MSDRRILINKHVDTDQLREAGSELAFQDLRVVGLIKERVDAIEQDESHFLTIDLIRMAFATPLPDEVKSKWQKAEGWVIKLMVQAHYIKWPDRFRHKMIENLQPVAPLDHLISARGFLNFSNARLTRLLETGQPNRTDSWVRMVAVENIVLSSAVSNGVYMTRPGYPKS